MNFNKPFLISLFVLIFSFEAHAASLGKIMLLGDSITHARGGTNPSTGSGEINGYRYDLFEKLITNGHTFDFVGTNNTYVNFPGYTPPAVNGTPFDKDHEGHQSWTTSDVLNNTSGEGNIDTWLTGYTPDIAIIQLGVNDILGGSNATDIADRLSDIIGKIKLDNASANIFVGTLFKYNFDAWNFASNPSATQQEAELNSLNTILRGTFANDNGVNIVELDNGTLGPASDFDHLYDGLHPGPAGEQFIADQFYTAVAPVPVPAAVWLFGSALVGLVGISRKSKVEVSDSI